MHLQPATGGHRRCQDLTGIDADSHSGEFLLQGGAGAGGGVGDKPVGNAVRGKPLEGFACSRDRLFTLVQDAIHVDQ